MNFSDVIKSATTELLYSDLSTTQVCMDLGFALLLGIFVFVVYRIAIQNEFYSKDFNISCTLVCVVTCAIVLAIQSNLVIGLGMVGALSIIRFRTAIKSPMDLLFMYWAVGVGIICGANLLMLAVILCVVVALTLLLLNWFKSPATLGLIDIQCASADSFSTIIEELESTTSFVRVKNRMSSSKGAELVVEYKTRDEEALQHALSGMEDVEMFSILPSDRKSR